MAMDELQRAVTTPAWWLLTVVVGLLLNVLAPFINKGIESAWAARSAKKKSELVAAETVIESISLKLSQKPTGLVEAKLEVIYWAIRILVELCVYILLLQVTLALLPIALLSAPIALLAFFNITRHWKKWRRSHDIHNLVLEKSKEVEPL